MNRPDDLTLPSEGLRERKKRETRQRISDVATRLFIAHGFEQVTVDEVAIAAGVAKMTVFNYFSRKEDLFFDRKDDVHELLQQALATRGRLSPLAALKARVHEMVDAGHPITKMGREVAANWKVVAESPALRAWAYDLLHDVERALARMLALSVDAEPDDVIAELVAATLLAGWRVAFGHALQRQRARPVAAVRESFLASMDRAFAAASALARGTRYG